jgi:uncharacterized paraquat-inducible protein A
MLNLETREEYTIVPQIGTTLWHCNRCDAFISIRSAEITNEAYCPVCCEVVLEFCGRLSNMPCIQFGDA